MKLNRTALRTVDILKLVSKKPDGITLDQICEQLSIPKTSAYDILTTLVHTGMVHVAREQKQRYTIGLTAYRVGINYTNNMDFIGTIDPVLKAFSKEVGKTVFFGVRADDEIVYICKYEPENPIITTATVGTKTYLLHLTWKSDPGLFRRGGAAGSYGADPFQGIYRTYHPG